MDQALPSRTLNRVAAHLATSCRRLAAQSWIVPNPAGDDRNAIVAGVTEGLLDAMGRARDGGDPGCSSPPMPSPISCHTIVSNALVAVAPAPECWAMLGLDRAAAPMIRLDADAGDAIDVLVHRLGARELARMHDLHALDARWPALVDRRGGERLRSVLAARLEVGQEFVGWLWLASETPGWFRDEDEAVARLAARILAPRVAAWEARAELSGAWG